MKFMEIQVQNYYLVDRYGVLLMCEVRYNDASYLRNLYWRCLQTTFIRGIRTHPKGGGIFLGEGGRVRG